MFTHTGKFIITASNLDTSVKEIRLPLIPAINGVTTHAILIRQLRRHTVQFVTDLSIDINNITDDDIYLNHFNIIKEVGYVLTFFSLYGVDVQGQTVELKFILDRNTIQPITEFTGT